MTLKKNHFLLALAMLILCGFTANAQTYTLSASGTVTEIGTGNPVANHQVFLQLDSNSTVPLQSTTTNALGQYSFSVQVPFQSGVGLGWIYTYDCQQALHQVPIQYSPNLNNFTATFQICTSTGSACQAAFSWNQTFFGPVNFTDNSTSSAGPVVAWFWDFGDGNTSTTQNPTHTYANPGIYGACLTITTSQGCTSTTCDTINVTGSNPCNAQFAWTAQGLNAAFTDQSTSNTPVFYSWSFGDGNSSAQQNPTHTYANPGTYAVCLTIFDTLGGGCQSTYCDSVTVQGSGGGTCQAAFTNFTNGPTAIFTDASTSSAGNVTSWFWDFGDGNTSTQQNPTHTYSQSGFYQACLTIGTSQGCQSTTCDTVNIQTGTGGCQAFFSFFSNSPGSFTFIDSSFASTGIISWAWDFGDGNSSTVQNPSHTYAQPGTYTVCLTITSASGCVDTYCTTITYTGGGGCQAFFTYSGTGTNSTFQFNDQSTTNGNVNYLWNFGDGNTSTSQNPMHTYANPGVYLVCLTIFDTLQNCNDTYCDSLLVQGGSNPTCQSAFNFTYNGPSVVFTDASTSSPGQIIGWTWDFGDGNGSNNANPTHTYANGGLYNVCLTIFTSDSCSSTSCQMVQASGGGPSCSADFTWSYNGTSVVFSDQSSSSPGNVIAWTWDFGDGNGSSQQNPTHTYAQGGLYTVCLTIFTSDSCSSTICYSLQANGGGGNNCQASFISYPDTTGQFSTIISNTSTGATALTQWFWDFGDGNTSNQATPIHQYNAPGVYLVCLTMTTNNCVSTFCDSVLITSPQNSVMVNSAVMNISNAVERNLDLDIYPNPAANEAKLRVELPEGGDATLQLVDLQGRVIRQYPSSYMGIGENTVEIDLRGVSQGLYFLNLQVGEYSAIKKLIVNPQ